MHIRKDHHTWVVSTPSKVNLFLEVLGPRGDGYHDLVTVMQAVDLCDELRILPSVSGLHLLCDHPQVPTGPSNLVLRAAELLRREAGSSAGACLRLEKRTPVGGGLGAGSANAAGALLGLNEAWGLRASRQDLHALAAQLGSDVNFFLEGGAAVCLGRGEHVKPLLLNWPLHYVLFVPPFGVTTADVFRAAPKFLTPFHKDVSILLNALAQKDFCALCRGLFNRLEGPAFAVRPELADLKRQLDDRAPGQVLLSGSGSTFFCVCMEEGSANTVAAALEGLPGGRVCRAAALQAPAAGPEGLGR